MKIAALLIASIIVLLLMPSAIAALDDFRLVEYENIFDTSTGGADTDSDVVLSQDLYGDETRNATVSSNVTADAPIVDSYVTATNTLTIIGLEADEEHRLTVSYKIDRLGDYFGAGVAAKVVPVLLILGVLGVIVAAVYNATKRGE